MTDHTIGLAWRDLATSREARWQPIPDLAACGYPTKLQRLWQGKEPNELELEWIGDRCTALQADLLTWGKDRRLWPPAPPVFDGSLASLIRCYITDPHSGHLKKRYRSRKNAEGLLRRIMADHGPASLADIRARHLIHWHEIWTANGHVAMGHALISAIRTAIGFGATILEDEDNAFGGHCRRLQKILHDMRFEMPKAREEQITADQVIAVRKMAHHVGRPSIALAQALQFELTLRQKDVIGEWIPVTEPEHSDVIYQGSKWTAGLRWSEIDENLVLTHTTSKRQKDIIVSLKLAPMVTEELKIFAGLAPHQPLMRANLPAAGPVILFETTGRPWLTSTFRWTWRSIARAAGVPDYVFNMDTRAGAISEATSLGIPVEHVKHAAAHSQSSMTERYARNQAKKAASVMHTRATARGAAVEDPEALILPTSRRRETPAHKIVPIASVFAKVRVPRQSLYTFRDWLERKRKDRDLTPTADRFATRAYSGLRACEINDRPHETIIRGVAEDLRGLTLALSPDAEG